MNFNQLQKTESKLDLFLSEGYGTNNKIIIYGAGYALPATIKKLLKYKFKIVGICDSNPQKIGNNIFGYEILDPNEVISKNTDARILISSPKFFDEIYTSLKSNYGLKRIIDIDLDNTHYFEQYEFKNFFKNNIEKFIYVYSKLESDSKLIFEKIITAHCHGERLKFFDAFTGNEDWYLFKSLLSPKKNTVFIDCGAYSGDTVKLFIDSALNEFSEILAFEPMPEILKDLKIVLDSINKKTHLISKGVAEKNGLKKFSIQDVYSSVIREADKTEKTISIPVVKLDTVIDELDFENQIDFVIKMDIEGEEYNALLGAESLIKKYKPRMAICLYHKVDDFVRIPELILKFRSDYKLHIRHQSTGCTDTILFAI